MPWRLRLSIETILRLAPAVLGSTTNRRGPIPRAGVAAVAAAAAVVLAGLAPLRPVPAIAQVRDLPPVPVVASIKPSADNAPAWIIRQTAAGTYSAVKSTVAGLIASAYAITPAQIAGIPLPDQRYDIDAGYDHAGGGAAPPSTSALLQSVLRERFGLKAHVEKRPFPVYLLKVARADRRLGPELKPSSVACGDPAAANDAKARDMKAPNGGPACGVLENPEAFIGGGVSMDLVARALRPAVGRPVVNATNLAGTWDVSLEFAPLTDAAGDRPTIFTALREALGLKLESSQAMLDVLVVDAIHEPTAN